MQILLATASLTSKRADMSDPKTLIPAATLVVFRHCPAGGAAQVLMVERSVQMRFAGGAAVFPGGRVDPADRTLAAQLMPGHDADDAAGRIAAVRETLEETGLAIALAQPISANEARAARAMLLKCGELAPVLEHFGWQLQPQVLVPFAHWCPNWQGAFDTRFYLADLGTGAVDITVDDTENTHMFWASPAEVLAKANAEELSVIFPTQRNLERLAQFTSFAQASDHARSTPVTAISPRREMRDGQEWLLIPEGLGYPVTGQQWATIKRG